MELARRGFMIAHVSRSTLIVPHAFRNCGAHFVHRSLRRNTSATSNSFRQLSGAPSQGEAPDVASESAVVSPPRSRRLVEKVSQSILRECGELGQDLTKTLLARGWDAEVVKLVATPPKPGKDGAAAPNSPQQQLEQGLSRVWGEAAEVESVVEMLGESVVKFKQREMLGYWIMDTLYPLGQWKSISYHQFSLLVDDTRALLAATHGVTAGARVAYVGRNCIEWAA
eukprot:CAMPEP_0181294166 /NCGR_PEP_ID=MMETSP1101-20121128/3450_1 /TAXON_ID=46948 /ORGANISM="Rhodomonas abbreviata, Strain Caron Lab Isolate" /LENGTH=225 /DNA_ID=CAMNT_0023398795 /DNA_START=101 /DNA_END=775 /DNA_ORIENTATION=+